MNHAFICLLTLFFSLSSPAIDSYVDAVSRAAGRAEYNFSQQSRLNDLISIEQSQGTMSTAQKWSMALDFAPGINVVKAASQTIFGTEWFTGNEANRWVNAAVVGTAFVGGGLLGSAERTGLAAGERGLIAAETATGEAKFLGQGFNQVQARYLAETYEGMGHHFLRREWGLPQAITDSRFSVLKPSGINRGDFYQMHYKVDPTFYGAPFPKSIGGSWSGSEIGLEKYGFFGRMWYGSPTPLKVGVSSAAAAGGGAYWYLNRDN